MAADSDVKRSLILDSRPHIITMCREKNEGKESKHDVSVPVDNQEKISSRSMYKIGSQCNAVSCF